MSGVRSQADESEVTALANRYRQGASLEQLAEEAGRDRRAIRRVLAEAGVALRPYRPLPVEQTGWIVTQYKQGATLRELAELTGSSSSSIRKVLQLAGVPRRPRGTRPRQRISTELPDTPPPRARTRQAVAGP